MSKATTDMAADVGKATHDMFMGKDEPKTLGEHLDATATSAADATNRAGAAVSDKTKEARTRAGEAIKP